MKEKNGKRETEKLKNGNGKTEQKQKKKRETEREETAKGKVLNKKKGYLIAQVSFFSFKTAATYSPTYNRSTIGATGLNFSVRNGKRWNPRAITT